jgi:N-acetylglucosaminyl-diphospho-decaprenol L-rhamnosyltransferase
VNAEPPLLIVVHWNRPQECIETVAAFTKQLPELRILVLDNHSSPDALEALRVNLASAEILALPENKGWGPAINVALRRWLEQKGSAVAAVYDRRRPGAYCLISAHDAQPAADCVTRLLEAMDRDPKIGIASPEYPDGSVPRLSARHGVSQEIAAPVHLGEVREIDVPHGTLMIARRECLAQIGLFDERYFAYGDEHELGARARRRGWKVALVGGAMVENPQTSTASELRSYLFTRNSLLLVHDYFGRFAAWRRAALILLNTIRLALRSRGDAFAFSPRARWRGCRDYFAGQFGPPSLG